MGKLSPFSRQISKLETSVSHWDTGSQEHDSPIIAEMERGWSLLFRLGKTEYLP